MAEDQTTSEELFTSTDAEGGSPDVSTTETKNEELNLSEENNASLDLQEISSKEEAKQKQIDAFYRKVKTGDLSLDEIPSRQEWMKPFIEARLDSESVKETKKKELDVSDIVQEALQAERAEGRFQDQFDSLKAMDLTANQMATINAEFKDLRSGGMSKDKALDTARRLAGVEVTSNRRTAMTPPNPNTVNVNSDDEVTIDNFREKLKPGDPRRIEFLEAATDPTRAKMRRFKNPVITKSM